MELLKRSIKGQALAQAAIAKVAKDVTVSDAEVQAYWDAHKAEYEKQKKTNTFAKAKATIKQTLLSAKQQKLWTAWLDKRVKEIGVTYADGYDPAKLIAAAASASPSAVRDAVRRRSVAARGVIARAAADGGQSPSCRRPRHVRGRGRPRRSGGRPRPGVWRAHVRREAPGAQPAQKVLYSSAEAPQYGHLSGASPMIVWPQARHTLTGAASMSLPAMTASRAPVYWPLWSTSDLSA